MDEPLHDGVEPVRVPVHVLDPARPRRRDHPSAADRGLSWGQGRGCVRARGRGLALRLAFHRGPIGSPFRLRVHRGRARVGLRHPGARPPGHLRQPHRHPRLAHAGAHRLLLGAGPAALRVVGCVRRRRRCAHTHGGPARQPVACGPRWRRVARAGIHPPPDADSHGRRDRGGPTGETGPTAWLGGGGAGVCDPRALHPLFVPGVCRQPRGPAVDVPLPPATSGAVFSTAFTCPSVCWEHVACTR